MLRNNLLSAYLDLMRFGAAMAVVFGHSRLQVFGLSEPSLLPLQLRLLRLTGQYAHAAVVIFFVISGYLVGGKLFEANRPQFIPKYLLDRATRIYTVAIPAMVIAFLFMLLQQAIYGQAYSLTTARCDAGADQLLGSMLFLHRGFMPTPCFNGPYWSLTYEVFYYLFILAVAVALFVRKVRTRLAAGLAAIALGAIGLMEPHHLWGYSTMWLLGMAVAQRASFRGRGLLFTAMIAALFLLQSALRPDLPVVRQELVVVTAVVGSILLLQRWQPFNPPRILVRLAAFGAGMSYSIYLFHAPALNLLRGVLENSFQIQLGRPISAGTPLYWYPLFISVATLFSAGCWWLFERHTMTIRAALADRLGIAGGMAHQPIPPNHPNGQDPPLPVRHGSQVEGATGS